ncbi:hypothetical protein BKA61DRAFT_120165 [Leptodontidium sp. MPI-SDFR-AT-0119]|nr:hypothetical protein BKA61DRAFT_120165 [Leptodontidium sp. MPI-SDFR-AT-0119]
MPCTPHIFKPRSTALLCSLSLSRPLRGVRFMSAGVTSSLDWRSNLAATLIHTHTHTNPGIKQPTPLRCFSNPHLLAAQFRKSMRHVGRKSHRAIIQFAPLSIIIGRQELASLGSSRRSVKQTSKHARKQAQRSAAVKGRQAGRQAGTRR